jgi:hypothetical protein
MRKFTYNNEEYEGIKISFKVWEKIGKPKGVFKYRGKKYISLFHYEGVYCTLYD